MLLFFPSGRELTKVKNLRKEMIFNIEDGLPEEKTVGSYLCGEIYFDFRKYVPSISLSSIAKVMIKN